MRMPVFSPSRIAVLMLAISSLLIVPFAQSLACPFCSAVSLTFSQEINQSDAAVIARLVEPPPASSLGPNAEGPLPRAKFEVVDVLKGEDLLRSTNMLDAETLIDAIMLEVTTPGDLYLIMGIEPPEFIWSNPIAINERAVTYLKTLDELPESGPDRLAFFQQYLEDEDDVLTRDAYDEFAIAPYDDVRGLENRMDPTALLQWIKTPKIPSNRRRLYATMLGICGTPADASEIEKILLGEELGDDSSDLRSGLDALIACYVVLVGPAGLDLIDKLFLDRSSRDIPFTETYAAVMALRFLGEESENIPRDRVLESLRLLLNEPKLADLVIADLARWQDWSVIEKLTTIYVDATPENIFVREPIVNYMKACPLPEAASALVKLREIDPDAVRRAATLAGLAGLAASAEGTPSAEEAPSTEQSTTTPVRVADVVADDVTSDRSMVVSTGSPPVAEDSQTRKSPIPYSENRSSTESLRMLKWFVWAVLVVVAAFLSRYFLQSGKRDAAG